MNREKLLDMLRMLDASPLLTLPFQGEMYRAAKRLDLGQTAFLQLVLADQYSYTVTWSAFNALDYIERKTVIRDLLNLLLITGAVMWMPAVVRTGGKELEGRLVKMKVPIDA